MWSPYRKETETMRHFPFFLASLALLAPVATSAQETPAQAPTSVVQQAKPPAKNINLPVSVKDKTDKKAREALEKIKISLELKNSKPEDAFHTLIKQIGSDYDIDPAFYPFGADEVDLPERVLDTFCQALGIGWWAEKLDETVMVHLVKLRDTMGKMDMLAELGVNFQALTGQAVRVAELALTESGFGGPLPDRRVKIDATTPREIKALIEDLCKQADLVFAIDSDVPSASKALAFENVPIKVALEALCATADLSMSVSKKGEKTVVTFSKATPKK